MCLLYHHDLILPELPVSAEPSQPTCLFKMFLLDDVLFHKSPK